MFTQEEPVPTTAATENAKSCNDASSSFVESRAGNPPTRPALEQLQEEPLMLRAMRTHAFLHLVSGATAGAVSRTFTAPLDRLKVILQLQAHPLSLKHAARSVLESEVCNQNQSDMRSSCALPRAPSPHVGGTSSGKVDTKLFDNSSQKQCLAASEVNHSTDRRKLILCGLKGFFRGNLTNCLKVVPETAFKFYAYDLCKHALARAKSQQLLRPCGGSECEMRREIQGSQDVQHSDRELSICERFLCGATAGVFAQLLIYPMEVVKTRLAAYSPGCMYNGVLQCCRAIYAEGGIRRLYRGLGPSLLGIIPYAGIDLAVFETLKALYVERVMMTSKQVPVQMSRDHILQCIGDSEANSLGGGSSRCPTSYFSERNPHLPLSGRTGCEEWRCNEVDSVESHSPPAVALLVMGGCSSLLGQVVAYPTALVRTRMQVDGSQGRPLVYRSALAVAAAAVRESGWRGLYRGLGANCCKALPAVSVSWIVYEKSKDLIKYVERSWTERVLKKRNSSSIFHPLGAQVENRAIS